VPCFHALTPDQRMFTAQHYHADLDEPSDFSSRRWNGKCFRPDPDAPCSRGLVSKSSIDDISGAEREFNQQDDYLFIRNSKNGLVKRHLRQEEHYPIEKSSARESRPFLAAIATVCVYSAFMYMHFAVSILPIC
jgi:hypothetical protein